MEIYLVRHTVVNIGSGICYGSTDVDLASTFEEEIISISNKIKCLKDLIFISSPLIRCKILADKLSESNFIVDDRLKELDFGDWENENYKILENDEDFCAWTKDYVNCKCPNGESFRDLYLRSSEFINELVLNNNKRVAIITHSGVIRSILAYVLNMPLETTFKFRVDNGSVSRVTFVDNSFYVDFLNK